jgi:hypothetical protein
MMMDAICNMQYAMLNAFRQRAGPQNSTSQYRPLSFVSLGLPCKSQKPCEYLRTGQVTKRFMDDDCDDDGWTQRASSHSSFLVSPSRRLQDRPKPDHITGMNVESCVETLVGTYEQDNEPYGMGYIGEYIKSK